MAPAQGIVTLLTDFGSTDAYAGAMKGVILRINPSATIVDLTHEVPPHDILAGAWHLRTACAYFPPGTVHCAVVDPGVGTSRRGIAVAAGGHYFVGPDNGLLSWAADLASAEAHELTNKDYFLPHVTRTFHGRDVFAPVAAHFSLGIPIAELGPRIDDPVVLSMPRSAVIDGELQGEVLLSDHFGNLITSIDDVTFVGWSAGKRAVVECVGNSVGVVETYEAGHEGGLVALFGSAGHLEIAVRNGSAAERLRVARGTPVRVRLG